MDGPRGAVGGGQSWGGITRRFNSSGGLRVICQLSPPRKKKTNKNTQPKSAQGLEKIQEVKPDLALALGFGGLRLSWWERAEVPSSSPKNAG